MQTKSVVIGLVAGLILGFVAASAVLPGKTMMGGRFSSSDQNGRMMGNIDRHFIEQMIPHHEGAIEMAKLALEKSKRPEMISLSNGIIEAQQKEIIDMQRWYKEWFSTEVSKTSLYMMVGGMMGGASHMNSVGGDLDELRVAKDFDLEFINQMIPHHEMAVMMASMLKSLTDRPEMKELADDIISSQTREIEMMRSWAKVWNK
jgi:uncharacterized protein (DUF305 family)